MVVLERPPEQVAPRLLSRIDFADKAKTAEYLQGAVNGNKRNTGVFISHLLE
jgi:hypothetical protein